MTRCYRTVLVFVAFVAGAQNSDRAKTFEVASFKISEQSRDAHVEYSAGDPGRMVEVNVPLALLIIKAYSLKGYQLVFPSWMTAARYDLTAKVPAGATGEEQSMMLQNLLVERLNLRVHRDYREMTIEVLKIAPGGQKLKEYTPGLPEGEAERNDPGGYPVLPPEGGTRWVGGKGGSMNERFTMEMLAKKLGGLLNGPVSDQTGLKGTYRIVMRWGRPSDPDDPPGGRIGERPADGLKASLQSQLGLRLEETKGAVEVLVVDGAERTPVAN